MHRKFKLFFSLCRNLFTLFFFFSITNLLFDSIFVIIISSSRKLKSYLSILITCWLLWYSVLLSHGSSFFDLSFFLIFPKGQSWAKNDAFDQCFPCRCVTDSSGSTEHVQLLAWRWTEGHPSFTPCSTKHLRMLMFSVPQWFPIHLRDDVCTPVPSKPEYIDVV